MSTLYETLLEQFSTIDKAIKLPAIQSFTLPPLPTGPNPRQNNFAYLSLTDGSVGITYVALDNILKHCHEADNVYLLGPSASCLPDALFAAGITHIGGFRVAQPMLFQQRWSEAGRWRDAGERYLLTRDTYPGAASLLNAALRNS